jgi:hypothetical protein
MRVDHNHDPDDCSANRLKVPSAIDTTTDRDRRILLAHKVFEKERAISAARRELEAARAKVAKVTQEYRSAVAVAVGCVVEDLQFSDSMVCFGTRLVVHCVWDLRPPNTRWPLCVFCGSPRDGE